MKKQETVKIITDIEILDKNGEVKVFSEKVKEDIIFDVPIGIKVSSGHVPKFRVGFIHFLHKINHSNTESIIAMNL